MIRNTKLFMRLILTLLSIVVLLQLTILWKPVLTGNDNSWSNAYNMVNTFAPLVTIVLLAFTFIYQHRQLSEQRIQTQLARDSATEAHRQLLLQQVEDRFFTFLKIHRENGDNMTYGNYKGKRVFIEVFKKFELAYKALGKIIEQLVIDGTMAATIDTKQKISIAYLLVFYGTKGENSTRMLAGVLGSYNGLIKGAGQTFAEVITPKLKAHEVVSDGFQASLGHYFRHMFQMAIYIHNQPLLGPNDKKFYLKRLRAQLSNHEIAVLFINSFSLGKRWLSYHSNNQPHKTDLITTYSLIQNLPADFFSGFDFRCFFPEITYESDNKPFKQAAEFKKCDKH